MQRCGPGAVGVRVAQGCAATNARGVAVEGWEERVSVAGGGRPESGKDAVTAAGQVRAAGAPSAGGALLADFLSRRKGGQPGDVRRARLRPALAAAFRMAVREEIERGRGLIWAAFVFAGGIAPLFRASRRADRCGNRRGGAGRMARVSAQGAARPRRGGVSRRRPSRLRRSGWCDADSLRRRAGARSGPQRHDHGSCGERGTS